MIITALRVSGVSGIPASSLPKKESSASGMAVGGMAVGGMAVGGTAVGGVTVGALAGATVTFPPPHAAKTDVSITKTSAQTNVRFEALIPILSGWPLETI